MSLMRRWFPSIDGPAHVSPYFYVAPKRRWWPTLLTFAAGGACALALLGPSQKPAGVAGTEKAERPLVLQVRPGDAVAAKDLASPPPAVVIQSSSEPQTKSTASAGEADGSEPAGMLQQPTAAPANAMAHVEDPSSRIAPETRIVATPSRPPVAKRYAVQTAPKSSTHRQVAKKSRRHEAKSDG